MGLKATPIAKTISNCWVEEADNNNIDEDVINQVIQDEFVEDMHREYICDQIIDQIELFCLCLSYDKPYQVNKANSLLNAANTPASSFN